MSSRRRLLGGLSVATAAAAILMPATEAPAKPHHMAALHGAAVDSGDRQDAAEMTTARELTSASAVERSLEPVDGFLAAAGWLSADADVSRGLREGDRQSLTICCCPPKKRWKR